MIPSAKPMLGDEERLAVSEVLESGHIAQGERTARFEEEWARLTGVNHAVAVSSGTAALCLSLIAHGIGPGDEVITTPFSFIASANSILFAGAKPLFADIDPATFNIDPEAIEDLVTPRTKALLPVHLYGHPADMEAILAIADKHGLAVIEDCCQAVGASIGGRPVGSFGTGCFSLYATKNITAGEGGMITTSDESIASACRMLRHHGMREPYRHEILGYNFRMTDIAAAIGLAQLSKLQRLTEARRANAAYVTERIVNDRVITPVEHGGFRHVYHQYTVRIGGDRDAAVQKLLGAGIGVGIFYKLPIHLQPCYAKLGIGASAPHAEAAAKEVLSLPVHPGLSSADLATIVREVNQL